MTITKEALEQAVQPVDGRVPTLREAGRALGVSWQRIHQLLRQHGIKKLPAQCGPTRRHFCVQCGGFLPGPRQPSREPRNALAGYCYECKPRQPRLRKYPGEGSTAQRRRLMGLCWYCVAPAVAGRTSCQKHLDRQRDGKREEARQDRARLLRISQLAQEILQLSAQEGQA